MAGEDRDNYDEQTPSPWYNRTPAVVGASVVGLAVIGILIAAVTFVSGQSNEPTQAPLNFVEPAFSATATRSSTPTTTETITSTSPPVTTDINPPSSTASSSSSSDTSSSDTSTSTRVTQSRPRNDESAPSSTRRGPRTNVTRTLYPQP